LTAFTLGDLTFSLNREDIGKRLNDMPIPQEKTPSFIGFEYFKSVRKTSEEAPNRIARME
jgi:hypothetical protein